MIGTVYHQIRKIRKLAERRVVLSYLETALFIITLAATLNMPCRFVCTTHTPYCMYCKRASSFYYSSGTSVFTVCHRRRHHRHYRTYPLGRAISHEHHLPASALEGVVCVQILELQHVILERRFRYDKKSSYVIVVRRALDRLHARG